MKTPDTTTAQIIAYAQAALSALVILFALDVSDAQKGAALTLLSAALGAFHLYSDAKIRNGRAGVAAASVTADAVLAAGPGGEPDGDDRQTRVTDPPPVA